MKAYNIAILFCNQDNPFWIETISMYREKFPVHAFYGDFLLPDKPRDGGNQAELMKKALSKDYDGMIINPLTSDNLLTPMNSQCGKFPLFDVGPKCDQQKTVRIPGYVPLHAVDFEEQGRICTEVLLESGHGPLACIGGPIDARQSRMRTGGAIKAAKEVGVDLLNVEWSDFTKDGGKAAMERLIPLKPGAVFCANDLMALGAAEAARSHNIEVPIGGVDLIPEALSAIDEGLLTASVGFEPAGLVDGILTSVDLFLREGHTSSGPLVNNILKRR